MYKKTMLQTIKTIYESAVDAVNGRTLIKGNIKVENDKLIVQNKAYRMKNLYMIGFGKAVLGMAEEIEAIAHDKLVKGILSVPFGSVDTLEPHFKQNSKIEIRECAKNNLPDEFSVQNTKLIETFVKTCTKDDVLLVLISGGGSACLSSPMDPITLDEKLKTIKLLVQSGADIKELNKVRKKLSSIKGGQLAIMCHPTTIISLVISDIVGSPLEDIASGPTVQNIDLWSDARSIAMKYNVQHQLPKNVINVLNREIPKQDEKYFENVKNIILGDNNVALDSAKIKSNNLNYSTVILSSEIDGSGDDVCRKYVQLVQLIIDVRRKIKLDINENLDSDPATSLQEQIDDIFKGMSLRLNSVKQLSEIILNTKDNLRLCLINGGEITLNMNNATSVGKGGRNLHLTLMFNVEMYKTLKEQPLKTEFKTHVWFSSAGTDGIDGVTDLAGAVSYPNEEFDIVSAKKYLKNFDSFNFYNRLKSDYTLKPGHTGTNVMDIHILIIEEV